MYHALIYYETIYVLQLHLQSFLLHAHRILLQDVKVAFLQLYPHFISLNAAKDTYFCQYWEKEGL